MYSFVGLVVSGPYLEVYVQLLTGDVGLAIYVHVEWFSGLLSAGI